MRRLLCGLFVCVVVLSGCQTQKQNTATPESPAHNLPSGAYPGPNNAGQPITDPANPQYPAPQVHNLPDDIYPIPGTSDRQNSASDYAPAPGDENMTLGNASVAISESSVVASASTPVQVSLQLKGTLPTPCYHLRIDPAQPDAQKQIQVKVYSVADKSQVCADVIQDFEVEFALGSFPSGHYSVYINGKILGEFDS